MDAVLRIRELEKENEKLKRKIQNIKDAQIEICCANCKSKDEQISKRDKALKLAREALKSIKNIGGGEPYSSNRAEVALTAINEALGGNE